MTQDVILFGIKFTLNPIAFTIPLGANKWDIYWYGILIAVGFLLALIYAYKNADRFGVDTDRMLDVVLVATPISIICARAYYLIFDGTPWNLFTDFIDFSSTSGFAGLAIYGGVIGAFASGAVMCKIRRVNILNMFDIAAVGFLLAQSIGRWGNFVNQEAFGGPTGSSWWGMTSQNVVNDFFYQGLDPSALAHPCFLYESIWCLAGFFLLNQLSKKRKFSGQIILSYCVWYGFGRGIIETLRTDSLMWGPFRVSCLLSFTICIAAIITLIVIKNKAKAAVKDENYISVFEEPEQETENG